MDLTALERELDHFDRARRSAALSEIAGLLRRGDLRVPDPSAAVNVHLHTSFSFNANGWSPSRVAWEARQAGLEVVGTVDFDVLDALEEVFEAGDVLGIRAVAALETRTFM